MKVDPQLLAMLTQTSVVGFLGYMAVNGIKKWVPPRGRSLVCLAVALIASTLWEMMSGKSWLEGLALGLGGGATFVGIHEMLTKGIQGDASKTPALAPPAPAGPPQP